MGRGVGGGGVRLHTPPFASPRFPPPRRPRRRPVVDMCHCAQISAALIRLLDCLAAGSSATPQIIRCRRRRHLAFFHRRHRPSLSLSLSKPPLHLPPRGAQPWITLVTSALTCGRAAVSQTCQEPLRTPLPPRPSPSLTGRLIPYHCFFAHAFVFCDGGYR